MKIVAAALVVLLATGLCACKTTSTVATTDAGAPQDGGHAVVAPPPERLASWRAPDAPAATPQSTPDGISIDVELTKGAPLDARARGVAVIVAPTTVTDEGSLDLTTSCTSGSVALELGRSLFDEADKLGVIDTLSLRAHVTGLVRGRRYAVLSCLRATDGSLAMPEFASARTVTAGEEALNWDGPRVATPSGPARLDDVAHGVVLGFDLPHRKIVQARVKRIARTRATDCVEFTLETGEHWSIEAGAELPVDGGARIERARDVAPGQSLLRALADVRVTSKTNVPCEASVERADIAWPDVYEEDGIDVLDAHPDAPPSNPPIEAAASSPTALAVVAPVPGYDCKLSLELDVRSLPPDVRAIGIATPEHHGPAGERAAAACTPMALELPRALLDAALVPPAHRVAPDVAVSFVVDLGGDLVPRDPKRHVAGASIACDGQYDVAACVRSAGVSPAETLAYWGKAGPTCIAEGTPVETPSGAEPVETLVRGDEVRSFDLATGRSVVGRVRSLRIREDARVARFELSNGEHLDVTAEHPVYVVEQRAFVVARDVPVGATLLAPAGVVRVLARTDFTRPARVFDLSIDGPHDYFASGALVHNY